jgi:hypothetical protein
MLTPITKEDLEKYDLRGTRPAEGAGEGPGEEGRGKPMSLWYLSFVDPGPPGRFLGGAVVEGVDLGDALRNAWALKINPGGEVLGAPIEKNLFPVNRLLSRAELESFAPVSRLGDTDRRPQVIGRN